VHTSVKRVLKPIEVQPPDRLRRETQPDRSFPGRCYEKAFAFVLAHANEPGIVLVHGRIVAGGPRAIDHAWVELSDGVVFDGVAQRFYQTAGYYGLCEAVAEANYTPTEAARLALATGHHGPWHKTGNGGGLRPVAVVPR